VRIATESFRDEGIGDEPNVKRAATDIENGSSISQGKLRGKPKTPKRKKVWVGAPGALGGGG